MAFDLVFFFLLRGDLSLLFFKNKVSKAAEEINQRDTLLIIQYLIRIDC